EFVLRIVQISPCSSLLYSFLFLALLFSALPLIPWTKFAIENLRGNPLLGTGFTCLIGISTGGAFREDRGGNGGRVSRNGAATPRSSRQITGTRFSLRCRSGRRGCCAARASRDFGSRMLTCRRGRCFRDGSGGGWR